MSVCFAIAVIGLGSMTYYINRPAQLNLTISFFLILILLCDLVRASERILFRAEQVVLAGRSGSDSVKAAVGAVSLSVVFLLSLAATISYGGSQTGKQVFKSRAGISSVVSEIRENVPENTPALGWGAPEIYSILGWDTQNYCIDFSDISLSPETYRQLVDQLNRSTTAIVVTKKSLSELELRSGKNLNAFYAGHRVAYQLTYEAMDFVYYIPAR